MLDTVMWLLNFPASHGYQMVFVAGFALLGLLRLSFSGAGVGGALDQVRAREGLPESNAAKGRAGATVRMWFFRVLLVVVAGGGVVGVLSLIGEPVTKAYIYEHGVSAPATLDGDWVTFTAEDGREYTLENAFFTPSIYPDSGAYIPGGDEPVFVRYLPGHPQAYVIDSTASVPR